MKKLSNGVKIFNGTPHPITFEVNGVLEVVPVDEKIDAAVVNKDVSDWCFECDGSTYTWDGQSCLGCKGTGKAYGLTFVTPTFTPTERGLEIIAGVPSGVIIIGSIIAAQAYPGMVKAMVPVPGYERVPPAEKRMLPDKFTVFANVG